MGKSSRKNKIWRGLLKKEQNEKERKHGGVDGSGSSDDNNQDLRTKLESKKKRANKKLIQKVESDMAEIYKKEFGHSTDDISDKDIDMKEQIENFVKNVEFWKKQAKTVDETKQLTPYEMNKRTYCLQVKQHLMKQLPSFPEAVQKSIMGGLLK